MCCSYVVSGGCSPEHPSLRAHGRSMLGGEGKSLRDYADDAGSSRSITLRASLLAEIV